MNPATIADPAAAVCGYLQANVGYLLADVPEGISGTGPAVFRPSLPMAQDPKMPLACIVVRPAGGYKMFGIGALPVADPVFDIVCYGAVQQQSYEIALAVAQSLRALRMSVWESTRLYWARVAGGPLPLPDQQTLWPATWVGAQVMHAEIATSGEED